MNAKTTEEMMNMIYATETSVSIASNWDAGYEGKIGDSYNGFGKAFYAETFRGIVVILYDEVLRQCREGA